MKINKPVFLKQKNMLRVLYSLIPVAATAIYFFGWRVLALLAVSFLFAFLTEWLMESSKNGKVSFAVFVTAALYGLSLPPLTPYWIAAVGIVIAILFGKEVFGGFGKNVFNPAIVGRAFVYVAFPIELTSQFVPVFKGFPGGFVHWSFASLKAAPSYLAEKGIAVTDAITAATPMWSRRDFGFLTELKELFLGNISGVYQVEGQWKALAAGSIGEVSALVIIFSGLYLVWTKTAQWRLMVATVLGAIALNVILRFGFGMDQMPSIAFTVFSGALMYAAVFMVTDPVSAPKQVLSQWIYGIFIGMMIVLFRAKSGFAGGVAFAILLGNTIAPSLDLWIKRYKDSRKKAQPV